MADYRATLWLDIVDIDGDVAHSAINTVEGDAAVLSDIATNVGTFATDMAAVSNGKVIRQGATILFDEAQLIVGTTPPTDAIYPKVEDGARLQFSNAHGGRAALTIPAPKEAVFQTGGERNTVNSTQTNVATLITFFKATALDVGLNALNLYQGGVKVARHARRRPSRRV